MPFRPPSIDDRNFQDLVNEVLARVPAHTPEWTNPRMGDPGRTIIELFAWLTDTLLYRANLIPERQRLAFLRLLGVQMRPAIPARGVVSLLIDDDKATNAVTIKAPAIIKGPLNFETRSEVTVLPLSAESYYKRKPEVGEIEDFDSVLAGLRDIYKIGPDQATLPYVTTPIFAGGIPDREGFNIMERTVDKCLWLALLAASPERVEDVKRTMGSNETGGQRLISIGVQPSMTVPTIPGIGVPGLFESVGPRAQIPHVWEITGVRAGNTEYHVLDPVSDTTVGLIRSGVQRLGLPRTELISAPSDDVRTTVNAGVGDEPPRIDDPNKAGRLVAWLRLRPDTPKDFQLHNMSLSWVGINAIEIDQRQTITGRVVTQGSGLADQEVILPGTSVEPETLIVQVEETERGYAIWRRTDDLSLEGRDAQAFVLDSEAGTIRLGNNVHGHVPPAGSRIRVAQMRHGGGESGNLPPGSLTEVASALDISDRPVTGLRVVQSLPTEGGEDAETLQEAEQRIPAEFRHGERAVTAEDYQRLAADTPGIDVGRVEVLPRFKPHQRQEDIPGIVSVITLPFKSQPNPPNPRPDRSFLESVYAYLDKRRPLATELYVIGCEYIQLGISVSVNISDGHGHEEVLQNVREALRRFLWPLAPGGPQEEGWPLGRRVSDRELEVVVARVAGVLSVNGINLFRRQGDNWILIAPTHDRVEIQYQKWQLPELLTVIAVAGGVVSGADGNEPPSNLDSAPNPFAEESGIAIPVVPEVCR